MKSFWYLGLGAVIFGTFGCALEQSKITPQQTLKIVKKAPKGEVIEKGSFQDSSNWEGYYHGILPCNGCQGIETWLHLKRVDGRGAYDLREKFLGVKNRYSKGGLTWEQKGTIAKLMSNQNKRVLINQDRATFIDETLSHPLTRVKEFYGEGTVFLLDDTSIQTGKTKGKNILKFSGITNYDFLTTGGYKSVKASYFVDCQTKAYTMSRVAHYKGIFAMRDFIVPSQGTLGDKQVVHQVSKAYCK